MRVYLKFTEAGISPRNLERFDPVHTIATLLNQPRASAAVTFAKPSGGWPSAPSAVRGDIAHVPFHGRIHPGSMGDISTVLRLRYEPIQCLIDLFGCIY